jgi:hypothetical protein
MLRQLAALVLFFLAPLAGQPSSRDLFADIDSTLADIAKITGMPPKFKVERDLITRDNLKKFLQQRIEETVKPEEIRVEALTLRLFGFIPDSYDLKESTINLLTEQAAAFYDYRKRKMFLLEGAPDISQRFVLIHELAHALADQHFRLEKFIQQGANDDSATARMAVMEGQAQWLMYEVIAKKTGQSLRTDPAMVAMFVNASSAGLSQYPELSNAPLYIRESLLFPYTRGIAFQQAVVEKLGDAGFAEVFRRPPTGTHQILHPDLYFERRATEKVTAPTVPNRRAFREAIRGEFGEFDLQILLKQFTDEATAAELAPLWRGGHFRVHEHKATREPVLAFAVAFDSPATASRFAQLYEDKILPAKPKRPGTHRVQLSGARVSIIEGIK